MSADAETSHEAEAFARRLYDSTLAALDLFAVYLGDRLGYYRALAGGGPASPAELADRTSTNERYAREWLEQQAASGILRFDAEGDGGRFSLPAGHAEVLLDEESLNHSAPLGRAIVGATSQMHALVDAYRTGGGLTWGTFEEDMRESQAALNRAFFAKLLADDYLPSILDVDARLRSDPPAHVADIACGAGWSSIAIARRYPKVVVDGYDFDEPSIEMASRLAAEAGLQERVRFHCRDAGDPELAGSYDLVTILEALHDMSRPVEALRSARRLAGESGAVLVMDERVGERFVAPAGDADRYAYGWSLLVCLPGGMAEQPSAATGAVMRPDTLRRYATEAGFASVEILPIDDDSFRFYRLHR